MKNKKIALALTLIVALALVASFLLKDRLFTPKTSNREVTLEWDMSPGALAGYRIYYGLESGKYLQPKGAGIDTHLTEDPSKPKFTIKNLTSGKTYFFAVTTYDASGLESDFSGEVSKIVP